MPSYNILQDYGLNPDDKPTSLSVSPYWVMAVFNLKYPATYVRLANPNPELKPADGVVVFSEPLIIVDDCANLSITTQKGNHVGNMSASLYPNQEYLSIINPGDYVFAWVVDGQQALFDLIKRIKNKQPCNKFSDGLKFYGKINSMRETLTQEENGTRYARYSLNANSFTELDATFFYEEHLAKDKSGVATQIKALNLNLDALVDKEGQDDSRGIVPNLMIVALIDVFLGIGVRKNLDSGADDIELKSTFGSEGDYAHILPSDVGQLLNKSQKSGRVLKTADVLETVSGVQKYSSTKTTYGTDPELQKINLSLAFQPDFTDAGGSRRFTKVNLLGRNSPIPPKLINQSLWSVLNQYLNPAANELYATLRVNPDGYIIPTVVNRQIPFTTDAYNGGLSITKFSELPRWIIPELIVRSVDVGRSDALRINFIHVYGTSDTADARNLTQQMVDAPPVFDQADISRSGLRPYMTTMPCWVDETRSDGKGGSGPKQWMDLIQDFMMGHHMTLTGTIVTSGIYSPICIGDNVQWDNNIYHIEGLSHSCSISPSGGKRFTTSLSLTNGVAINAYNPSKTDISLYARVGTVANESTFIPANNTDSVFQGALNAAPDKKEDVE